MENYKQNRYWNEGNSNRKLAGTTHITKKQIAETNHVTQNITL